MEFITLNEPESIVVYYGLLFFDNFFGADDGREQYELESLAYFKTTR